MHVHAYAYAHAHARRASAREEFPNDFAVRKVFTKDFKGLQVSRGLDPPISRGIARGRPGEGFRKDFEDLGELARISQMGISPLEIPSDTTELRTMPTNTHPNSRYANMTAEQCAVASSELLARYAAEDAERAARHARIKAELGIR